MTTTKLMCCEPGCGRAADFEVQEDRTDIHPSDGQTHACAEHLALLLGSVVPSDPVYRWIVSALVPVGPEPAR